MTVVKNYEQLNNELAAQLTGSTLKFHYTGVQQVDFCKGVQGGYNFSSLMSHEISFNTSTFVYWYRPCAVVQAAKCQAAYATSSATLCKAYLSTSTTTTLLARDAPSATAWQVIDSETVRATYRSGAYCSSISGPREVVADFRCNQDASTAPFISYLNENTTCMTYLVVQSSLACSAPPSCTLIPGGNKYNAVKCDSSWDRQTPVNLTNPTTVLVDSDDGTLFVDIPWNQRLYGMNNYNNLWICVNGWLGFGAQSASILSGSMPLTASRQNVLPVVAAFMTDLHNSNRDGDASISWSVEGVAPRRYMVVRWFKLNFFATRAAATTQRDTVVTFEVRVYEGTEGKIEVIYYDITPWTSLVTMGIQGDDGQSFTAWHNYARFDNLAINKTYVDYVYTGADYSLNKVCGSKGYNFSSIEGQDLVLVEGTTTVYYNPCGVHSACAVHASTERSMACAVISGNTYVNLAIYVPTASVWTYLNDGVQQYMPTGK